jgi:LysM repeat protein
MKFRHAAILVLVLSVMLGSATLTSAQNTTTHIVQPGETLNSIARQYGVTVQAIAFANGITNPDLIFAGQVLTIPVVATPTPPPGQTSTPTSTTSYTVVSGDTLFSLARRFGTTTATLVALNNLANPDQLSVGQVLKIPAQGQAATSTPVTSGPTATTGPTATGTPSTSITYVVQSGDTLSQIALRFNVTYQQIALLNGLDNPDVIFAGQTLIIRPGSATPTPVSKTATFTPTTAATVIAIPSATGGAPTLTQTATSTFPTETPTAEPILPPGFVTPTPLVSGTQVPVDATNRLLNPGFEADTHTAGFNDVKVVNGWEPFYCDKPYTADVCPALRIGAGNQPGMLMSRPNYDKTTTVFRVHAGAGAQSWTCPWSACRAGVYQTVDTVAGATCEAGAYVQSWSTSDPLSFTSQLASLDDRANSTWSIRIDLNGNTEAFADGVSASRGFGYDDGIYDHYALISYTFTATATQTSVFFEDLRLWPFTNNASFIDDAYLRCTQ